MIGRSVPFLICILFVGLTAQVPGICINEFQASNSASNLSPHYSEYADWLEVSNPGSTAVDIGGYFLTGDHQIQWNGTDDTGETVSSGIYFYRLRTNDRSQSRDVCRC
jgi:flagellar hook assembly protein FlgD